MCIYIYIDICIYLYVKGEAKSSLFTRPDGQPWISTIKET